MTAPFPICFRWSAPEDNICGRVHRGPVCGFLVVWLQVAIEPFALFHHSVFDYVCITVMFHR